MDRNKEINIQLEDACLEIVKCLENWVEIADKEDLREYDNHAIEKAKEAVSASKRRRAEIYEQV